ncbi:DUF6804 family protein [Microbacterium sp. ASV49]|uniref:Apolipoprotein N-acyltransferase n=1 Tax=Microbacterium candidum TaxID=3041922 RepID=A0ABT7MU26_9MICO|nr:DUF6804 family protein [Microbacterium sp. ASV49]MDL9977947.1 hypothetical protein [Microbacterium sp. ASV49]
MSDKSRTASGAQRNALAPGLLAAAVLFSGPFLLSVWPQILLYAVSILALIVLYFAAQAKQWWWIPVFAVIAVLWNPVFPFPFSGPLWLIAQPAAAVVFIAAGALIKTPRN